MPRLRALASFRPAGGPRLPPGSDAGQHLIRLAARVRRFAVAHLRFWELLPPFLFLRRAPSAWWLARGCARDLLVGVFAGDEPDAIGKAYLKEAKGYLDVQERELKSDFESFRKEHQRERHASHVTHAEQLLFAPLRRRGVTSDGEVLVGWEERVLSARELKEAAKKDEARAGRRDQVAASASEARATLRRAETTEQLLGL